MVDSSEGECAMQAGSLRHHECPRESMIMDGCCAIQPDECLDDKAGGTGIGIAVEGYRRLAK